MEPPPPPPPHGQNGSSGLPPGKYDIFVIPPHSAGSGFLYLPSLQPHRNSFLAGVVCTLVAVSLWSVVLPALREWFHMITGGGMGVVVLAGGVGLAAWAWGKTQGEGERRPPSGGATGAAGAGTSANTGRSGGWGFGAGAGGSSQPNDHSTPKSSWQRSKPTETKGAWEKARDEARKREDERKKAEELRKKADELLKKKADEERERVRLREKEARERREREAREKTGSKRPPQPTARTEADEDAYSYRPYDKPKPAAKAKTTSASSVYSDPWDAASQSTRKSTPPPSRRGPYHTKDPDKIVIRAVYSFTNAFNNVPAAQLVSGQGSVTDGLILRITTEGLFIDDDMRGVPQREWDVKAWTMKLLESGEMRGLHVLRATIRDAEGKRYVFILGEEEGWKVAVGLQRLRRGTQVRSLGVSGLAPNETKAILVNMGFL